MVGGALTDTEQVAAIVDEVGDTPGALVAAHAQRTWDKYAGKALLDRQLQVLYTTRDLLRLKMRQYSEQVDFIAQGDVQVKLSQRTGYLKDRVAEVQAEIIRLEAKAQKRRGGATLPITTVVPVSVADEVAREQQAPPQLPDPSAPELGGWPWDTGQRSIRP